MGGRVEEWRSGGRNEGGLGGVGERVRDEFR